MWAESFGNLARQTKTLGRALMSTDVLSSRTAPFERASAVLVERLAVEVRRGNQKFVVMVPPSTVNHSYVVTAGLLISDLYHRKAPGLPPEEAGSLIGGDLLLVTHAVGQSVELLRTLRLGDQKLQDIWFVDSFSRYRPLVGRGPRVFVANAGWILDGIPKGQITSVVIDATHPRTSLMLPKIMQKLGSLRFLIIVSMPLLESELKDLGYLDKFEVWLWDPEAKRAVDECVTGRTIPSLIPSKRHIWICPNVKVDGAMTEIHELLASMQKGSGRTYPGLWEAWSIYHRLRQLAVPLAQLEDTTYTTWGALSLMKRLERLQSEWPDAVDLQAQWPSLMEKLQKAYETLLDLQEPPKFWAVAERVQARLKANDGPLRVVVSTERESTMLNINLTSVIDGWLAAQQEHRVEVIWAKEEARRISAGDMKSTLLVGYRVGAQRHLDLYPGCLTEVIAYPYEVELDTGQQKRIYDFAEGLQEDKMRIQTLMKLHIPIGNATGTKKSPRPLIEVAGSIEQEAHPARAFLYDPTAMDLDRLVGTGLPSEWDDDARIEPSGQTGVVKEQGKVVHVIFEGGREVKYAFWQSVDVYHPATGRVQRYRATELRPSMQVVLLVDSVYEDLFDRMLDALRGRANPYTLMILGLWDRAKSELLKKHNGNRMDLFHQLESRGLSVGYQAVRWWFADDSFSPQMRLGFESETDAHSSGAIAPRQYEDMKILAVYSGHYQAEGMIQVTFKAIQEERGRRIKAGLALHEWLRAIVSGNGYDRAMASARELGGEVAEVLAALDVRHVREVKVVDHGLTINH